MRKGYKFLCDDMRSGYGDEPPWEIGVKREIPKERRREIALCNYGYHDSPTLWDALAYAQGPVACLTETGRAVEQDKAANRAKRVAASLTIVQAVNIDRELRLFAADCAERVLYIFERDFPKDDRPRKAIQATRDFANGKIAAAAWVAARAAAGAAAGDAAWDAAWAAARAAAGAAAWAAARAAAGDAAWDAAWAAAWAAARAAAGAAAKVAAIEWQRVHFNKICLQLLEHGTRE